MSSYSRSRSRRSRSRSRRTRTSSPRPRRSRPRSRSRSPGSKRVDTSIETLRNSAVSDPNQTKKWLSTLSTVALGTIAAASAAYYFGYTPDYIVELFHAQTPTPETVLETLKATTQTNPPPPTQPFTRKPTLADLNVAADKLTKSKVTASAFEGSTDANASNQSWFSFVKSILYDSEGHKAQLLEVGANEHVRKGFMDYLYNSEGHKKALLGAT